MCGLIQTGYHTKTGRSIRCDLPCILERKHGSVEIRGHFCNWVVGIDCKGARSLQSFERWSHEDKPSLHEGVLALQRLGHLDRPPANKAPGRLENRRDR